MSSSIYDSEQYLFELAQNYMRSRIIFTSLELKLFELLNDSFDIGLTPAEIAEHLQLYYIEQESRCLQDVLDSLTAMNFLERDEQNSVYKLSPLTRNYLLPNKQILCKIEQEFYMKMPQLDEIVLDQNLKQSLDALMLLRIKQLVDLSSYSKIAMDCVDDDQAEVIILWRGDRSLMQQAFNRLPCNRKGLLIVIRSNNEQDEVTLALNILLNMTMEEQQPCTKESYSKQVLKQIGFRKIERVQSSDQFQLLLAYK